MRIILTQAQAVASVMVAIAALTSCTPNKAQQAESNTSPVNTSVNAKNPKVVATSSVLCDLTEQIAANTVDLVCLVKSGTDPHIYEPTPSDRKAIEEANLILYSGYDFEPDLTKMIQATSNSAPKVAVNETAVPTPQKFEEDGKTVTDPHVFHSAQNGVRIAEVIRDNLGKLLPNNVAQYEKATNKITSELSQIDRWIQSQINTILKDSRTVITTHDALGYYAKAYGIEVDTLEGVSTEEKPTATKIKEVVETIEAKKVPTIFAELTVNPQFMETVARESKVKIADQEIFADGLGSPGSEGGTYQKMLITNTKTIVEGLGGRFAPFQPKS